jgi:hypothetical protein
MTTKPKTRKAPAKRTALTIALDRHKAAKAAWDAKPDADRIDDDPVMLAVGDALIDVAETPCASDAEFLEKLRYLFEVEMEMHGYDWIGDHKFAAYGSIIVAVDTHFGIDEAT